jgi:protocatechuate 3,4-dioxygenase beta subunit
MKPDQRTPRGRTPSRALTATPTRTWSRREALALLGSSVAVAAGCGSDDTTMSAVEPATDVGAGNGTAGAAGSWARGGTSILSASYPDPFAAALGSTCELTCRETIGPCYASTVERKDISEGYPGLPVRLSLLVVDENCAPVAGASIDIWHTRNTGTYSGDDTGLGIDGTPLTFGPPPGAPPPGAPAPGTQDAGAPGPAPFSCTLGDADAESHHYFRGTQSTDAKGRVDFDTCYPGWYTGRALHIHFIIRRNGQEYVTSQFYFAEELTREICATHPDYSASGQPDTTNSTDAIFSGNAHVLDTERQPDGVLLAYKTLVLRNSLDEELCGTDVLLPPPVPAAG